MKYEPQSFTMTYQLQMSAFLTMISNQFKTKFTNQISILFFKKKFKVSRCSRFGLQLPF